MVGPSGGLGGDCPPTMWKGIPHKQYAYTFLSHSLVHDHDHGRILLTAFVLQVRVSWVDGVQLFHRLPATCPVYSNGKTIGQTRAPAKRLPFLGQKET